jgi:hypothetical protein
MEEKKIKSICMGVASVSMGMGLISTLSSFDDAPKYRAEQIPVTCPAPVATTMNYTKNSVGTVTAKASVAGVSIFDASYSSSGSSFTASGSIPFTINYPTGSQLRTECVTGSTRCQPMDPCTNAAAQAAGAAYNALKTWL